MRVTISIQPSSAMPNGLVKSMVEQRNASEGFCSRKSLKNRYLDVFRMDLKRRYLGDRIVTGRRGAQRNALVTAELRNCNGNW